MPLHPFFSIAGMTAFAFAGGLALKQFSLTRDILALVAGFCLYGAVQRGLHPGPCKRAASRER